MNTQEFVKKCYEIREKECRTMIQGNLCNSDGVISPAEYFKTSLPKVLWLLKEAYGGNGIDQAHEKELASSIDDIWKDGDTAGKPTFLPMIKLANYIAGNGLQCETSQSYTLFKQTTAYVNIKKLPGKSSSSNTEIDKSYLIPEYNFLIKRQIDLYEPDVIVFGNVFSCICKEEVGKKILFWDELKKKRLGQKSKLTMSEIKVFGDAIKITDCKCLIAGKECCGDLGIYVGAKRLYFDAYHPSFPKFTDDYIRYIGNEILKWSQAFNKQ